MLVDLLFIVAAIIVLIAIYKLKFSKENLSQQIEQATQKEQLSQVKTQQTDNNVEDNSMEHRQRWQQEQSESDNDEDGPLDKKKQLRKQQKQKQKQQRKEAHEFYLQQQKQKRQKYEKESEERQRLEEEKRKKQQEVIQQLREEERKRKEQEFNKWKDMFKVEEEGKEKLTADEQKRKADAFNQQLIALLKKHKLTLLEDLSHKYKQSTKEIVEKLKQLEAQGLISGIFDERGKYLVIQNDEWNAIKNYITARGRVKKSDIMTECAKLIKIPDEVQEDLLSLIKDDEEKANL